MGLSRRGERRPHHRSLSSLSLALAILPAALVACASPGAHSALGGRRVSRLPFAAPAAATRPTETVARLDRSPTAAPTPDPPHPFFADHRIIAYYGNPASPVMGVLGDGSPEEILPRLRQQAAVYAAADPSRQVVPAMELIESVAQDSPTDNGLFLYRMDGETVDRYTRAAEDNGALLILDEQIGRSTPQVEVQRVLPRLANPAVQLALDPEFTMGAGMVPGRDLGSMDAADINAVQQMLEDLAVSNGLASKVLIVHEFQNDMVTHLDQLASYPHVALVLDADGFGTRADKLEKYTGLISSRPTGHAGVKLFYKYDPDLWTPADVLGLDPPPDVVIYQ